MDHEQVLTTLDEMVDDEGGLVIANDSNLALPSTPWQQAIPDIQRRFLPPHYQDSPPPAAGTSQTHKQLLANSAVHQVNRQVYGYRLGDRQAAFEDAIRRTLLSLDPADISPNRSPSKS
ncbi:MULTISPECIES: hypothetical protein [Mycobacterium]|uniref:hypothetical protein n=1 Tax=Mycobacterium TaxID=1763 RepID=UPI0009618454|nr:MULTISPECIES: hypothetical protein [Mycobacterium]MCG7606801.1 hypothetical protein [Mycobacterium sp. CnD-18-1]OLT98187.1 hypothetical protein BKG60_01750 [Mycobacterium syngnathidarum]